MRRKNYIFVLFSLMILSSIIIAGTGLSFIQGHYESANIVIEWQSEQENNVKSFSVERQTPNGSFVQIGTVAAQGDYSYYKFVDQSVYKTLDKIYIYRVSITDAGGNSWHSASVAVSMGKVSGFKSTWGSIKALFR